MHEHESLIYDWNAQGDFGFRRPAHRVEFDDETLRDGLQSPSVHTPTVQQKIEILHLMDAMGLDTADIGLPGAGGVVKEDTLELARAMARDRLKIAANCAARTLEADVRPIAEIVQKTGRAIEACLFIGSSPIRRYAENWTIEMMLEHTRKSVSFAAQQGLSVMYVTEDTTRAHPEDLRRLYLTAIECGAKRICLCDTCGHATPNGVFALVGTVRRFLEEAGIRDVRLDFHGHMDRGLGVWNAITALMAGVHRVHGTALGIGERVGNAPMDEILVNLKLLGWIENDLTKLYEYCRKVSEHTRVPIPHGYPVVGKDAFETATGVHAAAVIKALRKGDRWLADRVYSGVPAADFGREQVITIGPMSGKSNIVWWLEKRGLPAKEEVVNAIFEKAKQSTQLLTEVEIMACVK
ncbi:MAG: 2-isopropylmalate synthase [Planctomycetes bacterium]|nr:2-isopropylmalate synthase [Planctomycetota bacterium]